MKKFKINTHTGICICSLIVIAMIFFGIIGVGAEKDYIEHEVLSCIQYVSINVDEDGDVLNEDLCYAFTYREDDSKLLHVTEYSEDECNTVLIGEENKFVMYDNGDTKLYLTREVLSKYFYTKITEFEYEGNEREII